MSITIDSLGKYDVEVRAFAFDYQDFPEVQAGETLSAPVVTVLPAGPTIGSPAVNAAIFYPGGGRPRIPIGKGVSVSISGGTAANDYTLTCTVTSSGGATLIIKGTLRVE
jgi:hypothetical protein